LGKIVSSNDSTFTVMLNFHPKLNSDSQSKLDQEYYAADKENRCVVCGSQ
jgi:hypothetical protein